MLKIPRIESAILLAQMYADGKATTEQIEQALQIVEQRHNPIMVRTQFELELCRLIVEEKRQRKERMRRSRTSYTARYWHFIKHIDKAKAMRKSSAQAERELIAEYEPDTDD